MPPIAMYSPSIPSFNAPKATKAIPVPAPKVPLPAPIDLELDFVRDAFDYCASSGSSSTTSEYGSDSSSDEDEDERHPSYELSEELLSGGTTVCDDFLQALPPYFHSPSASAALAARNGNGNDSTATKTQDDFILSPSPSAFKHCGLGGADSKHHDCYERVDYLQFPFAAFPEALMPTWSHVVSLRVPRHVGELVKEAVYDFHDGELLPGLQYESDQTRQEGALWRVWALKVKSLRFSEPVEGMEWNAMRRATWRQTLEASDLAFDSAFRRRRFRVHPSYNPWIYGPLIGVTRTTATSSSPSSTHSETPGSLKSCLKLPSVVEPVEVEILSTLLSDAVQLESASDCEREEDGATSDTEDDEAPARRPNLLRATSMPPLSRGGSIIFPKSPTSSLILDSESQDKLMHRVAAAAQRKLDAKRRNSLRAHRSASPPEVKPRRIEFSAVVDRRVILDLEGSTTDADGGSSGNEESSEGESDDESRAHSAGLRAARARAGKPSEHRRSVSAPSPRTKRSKTIPRSLTAPIESVPLAPAHDVPEASDKLFFDPSWMPEEVAAADVLLYRAGYSDSDSDDESFEWGSQKIAIKFGGGTKRRATWSPAISTGGRRRRRSDSASTKSSPASNISSGLTRSTASSTSLSSLSSDPGLGLGLRVSTGNLQQFKYKQEATGEALSRRVPMPAPAPALVKPRLTLIREEPAEKPVSAFRARITPPTVAKGKTDEKWIENMLGVTFKDDDEVDADGLGYWDATPTPSSSPAPRGNTIKRHLQVDCSGTSATHLPSPSPTMPAPDARRWSYGTSSVSALRSLLGREPKPTTNKWSPFPTAPGPALAPRR